MTGTQGVKHVVKNKPTATPSGKITAAALNAAARSYEL
jgi:hypothetical protein